jgi:F0F1-type ATP synthase membrane subunit c/vacuolar-type H+-ATPase subunit K
MKTQGDSMRNFAAGVLVLSGWLLASVAAAQTSAPATQAAADQTTPQGTLILLTRAMQSGESAGAKPLLLATSPAETALADVLMQSIDINGHFRGAVAKSFGDGVADMFAGSNADLAEAEKNIAHAKVTIDKDHATIEADPQGDPVKLTQIDGQWKLAMSGISASDMDRTQKDLKIRMGIMSQVTDELGQGKYKTPEELSDALKSRLALAMLQAAKDEQGAATQPATMPAMP